ncbi:FAD:protein FMN transferase [Arthrobacter sp. I2-34]|uniref:FAD:protein FMN transferase n=1 Tax=Arthrobacter hankyongi TaxID=2904801 RepID=A0ABS9L9D0_9MICC|nr:FAD:protein FMN transferase [Arthrobacter hankyongi]MCG2623292.1 FAD:protein FMN transferase [Arthrobacter hankyongi]
MTGPAATERRDRATRVFDSMGTVVSLTAGAADGILDEAAAAVEGTFAGYDRRFSLYRPDSELSRIAARELSLAAAGPKVREMYALAMHWQLEANGVFTPVRTDGVLDLSGVVKAAAIRDAGEVLLGLGLTDWCLNAGGDVLTHGGPGPGAAWRAGIVDPADRGALLADVTLGPGRQALATSGSSERGAHIWSPAGAEPLAQVSVLAADIVTADVLATAVLAGGVPLLEEAVRRWPVQVLAVRPDGSLLGTPGWKRP